MIGRDEVAITVPLHEMDFVALLRASRVVGMPRDELVRRAIAGHLVALQRQGLDLGIVLPEQGKQDEQGKQGQPAGDALSAVVSPPNRPSKGGNDGKTP